MSSYVVYINERSKSTDKNWAEHSTVYIFHSYQWKFVYFIANKWDFWIVKPPNECKYVLKEECL